MWLLVLLVSGWLPAPEARARTPLVLDTRPRLPTEITDQAEYWVDPGGRASAEEVSTDPRIAWQPTRADTVYPLNDARALWIRFTVAPRPGHTHWYIEIPFANLDRASLYSLGANGQWQARHAGDRLPVAEWAVPGRQPLLPLEPSEGEPTEHLLRIAHAYPTSAPMLLTEEHQLLVRERLVSMGLGLYLGLTLLASAMALAAAVWMRDPASALFVPPTLLLGLCATSFAGLNGWLLWPHHATWNDRSSFALPTLALASMVVFVSATTAFRVRAPHLRMLPAALVSGALALVAVMPLLSDRTVPLATAATCAVLLVACIALPAWAWWRGGDRHAVGLLVGMLCLAGPGVTHLLRLMSIMPTGLISRFVLLSGAGLQLVAVLVTLIWRGRDRSLTRQRMRGLDRADPATGLATHAVVRERLQLMTARAQRQNHAYAVLLIDLMNLPEVRQKFGRRAGQELPLRMADRLLGTMRAVDTVGRLGDARFVMLMDGPIDADAAAQQAQQVLARCLRPIHGRPDGWTPRVRMALGVLPRDGQQPEQVLDKLGVLLDTVPAGDTRAVFTLG